MINARWTKYCILWITLTTCYVFCARIPAKELPKNNDLIHTRFKKSKVLFTLPTKESLKNYPPRTALSKKSLQLRIGMTKKEVIKLLGLPTWARGIPPLWTWQNGKCNPVEVLFNYDLKVVGFNEGRELCIPSKYTVMINDNFLCTNPENKNACG